MSYALLTAAHGLGALLLGVALAGSWLAGERARHAKTAGTVARAAARKGALARRLLLPGVLLLGASGAWLVASHYGGWNFVRVPWLAGMVALFVFQSVWANTVGRAYAIRLGRLLAGTREADPLSPELRRALAEPVATFGLDRRPHEANVLRGAEGAGIFVYDLAGRGDALPEGKADAWRAARYYGVANWKDSLRFWLLGLAEASVYKLGRVRKLVVRKGRRP